MLAVAYATGRASHARQVKGDDPAKKTQRNWVVEIGGRMPRIDDAGDICLRRPRPTQAVEPMMMMIP